MTIEVYCDGLQNARISAAVVARSKFEVVIFWRAQANWKVAVVVAVATVAVAAAARAKTTTVAAMAAATAAVCVTVADRCHARANEQGGRLRRRSAACLSMRRS